MFQSYCLFIGTLTVFGYIGGNADEHLQTYHEWVHSCVSGKLHQMNTNRFGFPSHEITSAWRRYSCSISF